MDLSSSSAASSCNSPQPPTSLLTALAVFKNILNQELIRSLHGYRVDEEERWVEREYLFSPTSCLEIRAPIPRPLLLLGSEAVAAGRRRPGFWVGQPVGLWLCILAFDSHDTRPASSPVPPILSFSRNPRLKSIPTLASDLQKVFQLRCITENKEPIHFSLDGVFVEKEDESSCSMVLEPAAYQEHSSHSSPAITRRLSEDQQNDQNVPELGASMKRKRAATEHVASIALTDLAKYFNLPITEASRNLKVGLTVLKRKCREFGIPRWPHRKIKSLDTLIQNLQEELHRQERDNEPAAVNAVARRQRMLESEKEGIERRPFMELQRETKRFRQDVFKRRHMAKALSHKCQPS